MSEILLTIGIPTYNRASLLNQSIGFIVSQIEDSFSKDVELFVSDNCSADNTSEVVDQYIKKGYSIEYNRNDNNLGADGNIALCFKRAKGKYVWVFSDDDLLYPGYLKLIIDFLKNNEIGCAFLEHEWYKGNPVLPEKKPISLNIEHHENPISYIHRVNYWVSFITGNIINKSLLRNYDNIDKYMSTNLVQLSWVLPVVFAGVKNVIVKNTVITCLEENTGGYKLINVFGRNFSFILNDLIKQKVIKPEVKRIINSFLLKNFFPHFVKRGNNNHESEEKIFITLLKLFWNYREFWKFVAPLFVRN